MSKKLYADEDINDLVETDLNSQEEFYKGRGPDKKKRKSRGTGNIESLRNEIHAYHAEHSDKETQESMKRYLDPSVTDKWSHSNRVSGEHATMRRRPSVKDQK